MFADVALKTQLVFTVKVAVVAPCATVTLPGTVAAALSLASVTMAPPWGAGLINVTVPVEESPPITLPGFNDTDASALVPTGTK
jgi:hypothetical protein